MADTDRIEMSWILDAKPKAVFDAWLSSDGHAAMTGGAAECEPKEGNAYTAWDGYISGVTKKIDRRARKLVQTWRTLEFSPRAPDSRLEVEFRAHKGKTQVLLKHTKLQKGDGAKYTVGWYQHYLEPMTEHFGGG
jgi:uncharacterized protein YndB with AHSA1/START domain